MSAFRITLFMSALLLGLVLPASPPPTAAAEEEDVFVSSMRDLSKYTEDVLYYLLRSDTENLRHTTIRLQKAATVTLSAAQVIGLGEEETNQLLYILEDAQKIEEEIKEGDIDDAVEAYYELVDRCIACHVHP